MNISENGLQLIRELEGFPYGGRPYWDQWGRVWTIGYGETHGVTKQTKPWTEAHAFAMLKQRMNNDFKPFIESIIRGGVKLNQNQFDALCSFIWNCGPGAISKNTEVGQLLRANRLKEIPNVLTRTRVTANGTKLSGLVNRRRREANLFASIPIKFDWCTPAERKMLTQYDDWKRRGVASAERKALRNEINERAKQIWRLASSNSKTNDGHGWRYKNRAERYHSLKARVR